MPEKDALNDWPVEAVRQYAAAERALQNGDSVNVDDLDSGAALQKIALHYSAHIRRLKERIAGSHKENDRVLDDYIMQNLELINLNKDLENKVKARTQELEIVNASLEVMNQHLSSANLALEDQKKQLQELSDTKEALMHMIVHDLKNPLTAVLSTLSFFTKGDFGVKPEMHDLLKSAHGQSVKLLSMIQEILFISRMRTKQFTLKLTAGDLTQTLRRSLELMQNTLGGKKLDFRLDIIRPAPAIMFDGELIERVVNNLLNNAIKYATPGSCVVAALEETGDGVRISVANEGEPIPAIFHEKIFELFSRVNAQDKQLSGTGLGLAFCKLAVEAHRGSIEVISPVSGQDQGVCFRFYLPRR